MTVALAGLRLLLARDSLDTGEAVPLPEGSIARLGRGEIQAMALSADGTRLDLGREYGVWIRDGRTGADLARLEGASEGVELLALPRRGPPLAGGGVGPGPVGLGQRTLRGQPGKTAAQRRRTRGSRTLP